MGRNKWRGNMNNFIKLAKEEVLQLENTLKQIDEFLENAPQGSLKWQNKKEKTYYYHQFMEDAKWTRRYIKKSELLLVKKLAQKHYYIAIRPILKKLLYELKRFLEKCPLNELEDVYDNLSVERKRLVMPLQVNVNEKVRQWQEETFEKNIMHPENLRYETEQGDMVRSKSEVIIANMLYSNRKNILYKYERPLEVVENGRQKIIYPDFTILNIQTGKVIYWEHAGRMDDLYYSNEFVKKMNTYISNDLLPGRDLVVSFESQNTPLDIKVVKKMVKQIVFSSTYDIIR